MTDPAYELFWQTRRYMEKRGIKSTELEDELIAAVCRQVVAIEEAFIFRPTEDEADDSP